MTANRPIDAQTSFELSKANAMLPLVKSIVREIIALSNEIDQTRSRLDEVGHSHSLKDVVDVYSTETQSIEDSVTVLSDRVKVCRRELVDLGISIENFQTDRCIDFLSADEDEVQFCWSAGETTVAHWHRTSESCRDRKSIASDVVREALQKANSKSESPVANPSLLA